MDQDALKKMAAAAAADLVQDGQIVGLGTGSTFKYVIAKLADRVKGGLRIKGVPTSLETARLAKEAGIPLLAEDAVWSIDLALDGADQVDPQLNLIKGGGGALLKEKIVASAAAKLVIAIDESKRVPVLGGSFPLPVEVVRFGWATVAKRLEQFGCRVAPRLKDGKMFVTESDHYILDLSFPKIEEPGRLETELEVLPGVVCTGLFVRRTDMVLVATPRGMVTLTAP